MPHFCKATQTGESFLESFHLNRLNKKKNRSNFHASYKREDRLGELLSSLDCKAACTIKTSHIVFHQATPGRAIHSFGKELN